MSLAPITPPSMGASFQKVVLDPFKALFKRPTPAVPTPTVATPIPGRVPGEQGFEISGGGRPIGPTVVPPASTAPTRPVAPVVHTPSTASFSPTPPPQVRNPVAPPVAPVLKTEGGAVIDPKTGAIITPAPTPGNAPGSTGTSPDGSSPTKSENDLLLAEYLKNSKLTPDEIKAQADLDALTESEKTAFMNTEDQAIPLEFITGQKASIEKRALGLAEPLQNKLARLQAARTSSLAASKFALDRSDKKVADEKADKKPLEGTSFYDPVTKTWNTAPKKDEGFTLSEGQKRYDANGKLIASVGKTATPGSGSGTGSGTGTGGLGGVNISSNAKNIIDLINKGADMDTLIKGTSKESQNLRNEVYRGLAAQGGRPDSVVTLFKDGKEIVDDMLKTSAYKALGGWSTRLGGQFGTGYGDAMAKAQQLSAILARDNLGLLKGSMSDKDLEFIKAMSTGFEGAGIQSEKYLKDRLTTIQGKLAKKIAESGGGDQPKQMQLPDGSVVSLQADGTYK